MVTFIAGVLCEKAFLEKNSDRKIFVRRMPPRRTSLQAANPVKGRLALHFGNFISSRLHEGKEVQDH